MSSTARLLRSRSRSTIPPCGPARRLRQPRAIRAAFRWMFARCRRERCRRAHHYVRSSVAETEIRTADMVVCDRSFHHYFRRSSVRRRVACKAMYHAIFIRPPSPECPELCRLYNRRTHPPHYVRCSLFLSLGGPLVTLALWGKGHHHHSSNFCLKRTQTGRLPLTKYIYATIQQCGNCTLRV